MRYTLLGVLWLVAGIAVADGPNDNVADKVRRVPPPGKAVPAAVREELEVGLDTFGKEIAQVRDKLKPGLRELLPDVQIYHNAVRYALKYDEFHSDNDIAQAPKLLEQGRARLKQLAAGEHPWTTATGLVVRGYVSKLDDSVQPYGLVVPKSYHAGSPFHHRLDLWFHGRGETLSELNFIAGRQSSPGEFTPANAFVLHPYGRYCNANHFAGEIDTLEALDHVRKHYPIDENRIVVRGFSMGGAACWNFAVHYADRWAAAAPGAGFSETPDFLRVFQGETLQPNEWQAKLLHWYDCTDWALNILHCPTVAYSGDKDKQKQAADVMATALKRYEVDLVHIIGRDTAHSYHPDAKAEINRRIDRLATRGRDSFPLKLLFTTWTLRYPQMHWLRIEGMGQHWERARVEAEITSDEIRITPDNVTAFTVDIAPGDSPFDLPPRVKIVNLKGQADEVEQELAIPAVKSDRSLLVHARLDKEKWKIVPTLDEEGLQKRPMLQGPIDDAFMDRFLMVRPTGKAQNDAVGTWIDSEYKHAVEHWRQQFRGELKPKDDADVTDADIASSNLVLWGDPTSNRVLAKIADKLPIKWTADAVMVGTQKYEVGKHVPVLIYPNPLNPKKYVVLNSGFTFREYDYLNNARQIPHLPDWAVLDINQPRTPQRPAGIAAAGFFDERWQLETKGKE